MDPEISVIITTYNRAKILRKTLKAYLNQTCPREKFEILIIDDGSTENVLSNIKEFLLNKNIKYFKQENKGPCAARNLGISKARGKYVLITGDDIIPSKNFLYEHLKFLKKSDNIAVLGKTEWAPWIKKNRFTEFFIPFNYKAIKDKNNCPFTFFYTSNISLEKKWFEKEKFDENFKKPAYEDTEMGYRLFKKGLRIVFNEKAIAYHDHQYDENNLDSFFKRQEWFGEAAARFYEKHPELRELLVTKHYKIKYPIYKFLIKTKIINFIGKLNKKLMWRILSSFNYIKGFKKFRNEI